MLLSLTTRSIHADTIMVSGTQKLVIIGDDWGPGVVKTILTLDTELDAQSLTKESFTVEEIKEVTDWTSAPSFHHIEGRAERTIKDVYLSDAAGNKVTVEKGSILTIEMEVNPNEGSPFIYDVPSGLNSWCAYYKLAITLTEDAAVSSNGTVITDLAITENIDLKDTNQRISLVADDFSLYTYTSSTGKSYSYGEYVPTQGTDKRPLVIWLHGAGEGGADNYIDLLGNEVTALADTTFQSLFNGAYILTPQSPTMWMDDGNGNYQSGDTGSCYTEDLMALIDSYVKGNPNIDTNRILIGGCSNGGYMTMEMILTYPEYFTAAYPICEAFSDAFITDKQIQSIIDNKVGIWFTHALNDETVIPEETSLATYKRFIEAGATNIHISTFDNVIDTTGRFSAIAGGTAYEYNGHWSWTYFFNNECCCDECQENAWQWLAKQTKYVEPKDPEIPTSPAPTENKSSNVKTGDSNAIASFSILIGASLLTIIEMLRKQKISKL